MADCVVVDVNRVGVEPFGSFRETLEVGTVWCGWDGARAAPVRGSKGSDVISN